MLRWPSLYLLLYVRVSTLITLLLIICYTGPVYTCYSMSVSTLITLLPDQMLHWSSLYLLLYVIVSTLITLLPDPPHPADRGSQVAWE